MRRFRDLQKSRGVHMKISSFVHRIVLFSLYEFYFDGFSYKVFNEAISALCMLYHLIFPHRGFLGDDLDYHGVFSYIFPLGFKEFYPDISMHI
jgi:hypothetical protein